MIKVSLFCVGRLKEKFYIDAVAEYQKRLGRYCSFSITELPEYGDPVREGKELLAHIPAGSYIVALCIEGRMISSADLAAFLADRALSGDTRLCFLIGGSDGLSDEVKRHAAFRMSMSPMTFPHHLARVMLAEQLYRGFSINAGAKYHK